MSTTDVQSTKAGATETLATTDMKLEVVVLPVSDVDRAKQFYGSLGWRVDRTPPGVVQLTPHGSACSVHFGPDLTAAAPGSGKEYLVVTDIEVTRDALTTAGVEVSPIFHIGPDGPVDGLDPERRSYFTQATFSDPDGNVWVLQEVTTRLPGRVEATETAFASTADLAAALRRAEAAHGEHEKRTGQRDEDWPDWYATYMAAEVAGTELPT